MRATKLKKFELMTRKVATVLFILLAITVILTGCSSKDTENGVVVKDASEFYSALQNKVRLILVDDLTFAEDTVVQLNYSLTIRGNGEKATIRNAHFDVVGPNVAGETNAITFENLVLDGGYHEQPAGADKTFEEAFGSERENLRCINANWGYADLKLSGVEITGYASVEGSAIYIGNEFREGAQTLVIDDCDFYGNVARNGTVKVFNDKLTTTMQNSRFHNNTAGAAGGFVISNGKKTIENCDVYDNVYYAFADLGYEERGGGVYLGGVNATMTDCVIKNNETKRGGGLAVTSAYSGNGDLLIKNCRIENNRAESGGAVFIDSLQGQPINFIGCEFYGNTATSKGSVLYAQPYAYWTKKYNGGQVNILFSTVANNTAPDTGTFGFYESDGLLGYIVLRGCLVIGDDAYETSPSSYNYIATAAEALSSGAITDLNIAKSESLQAVKGSEADIVVPVSAYKNWHSTFAEAKKDASIGQYLVSSVEKQVNIVVVVVPVVVGVAVIAGAVVLLLVVKKKRSQKAEEPQQAVEEQAEEQPSAPVLSEKDKLATLTEREYRIVALTLAGKTREQIAEELRFSVGTIKFDLMNIYRKLECASRTDLIIRYKDFF